MLLGIYLVVFAIFLGLCALYELALMWVPVEERPQSAVELRIMLYGFISMFWPVWVVLALFIFALDAITRRFR